MKTLKSFRLFVVLFVSMMLGTSFTGNISAQVNNPILESIAQECNSAGMQGMAEDGIISMHAKTEGNVLNMTFVVDENVVTVDAIAMMVKSVKEKCAAGEIELSYENQYVASFLEEENCSFCYIIKGHTSGAVSRIPLSPKEMLAMGDLFAGTDNGNVFNNFSVEEMVDMIDAAMNAEDPNMRCLLKGKKVVFEMTATNEEFQEIKELASKDPDLLKGVMGAIFSSQMDKDSQELVNSIKARGYSFAVSVRCGYNTPIMIDLDL